VEHPQLPHLVRCVKAFLRRDGLNDVSRGGLGSHAVTVAVACFLTQVRSGCRRRRWAQEGEGGWAQEGEGRWAQEGEGRWAQEWEGEGEREDDADDQGDKMYAGLDLGGLLVGFMTAMGSLDISDLALSIRHGGIVRKPKEWMTPAEYKASGRGLHSSVFQLNLSCF